MTNNISGLLKQLRGEHRRIGEAISVLETLDGASRNTGRRVRRLSAAGRRRIVAAQRARWAKIRNRKIIPINRKRNISAAGRRRIAAAQRARWAKIRAAK